MLDNASLLEANDRVAVVVTDHHLGPSVLTGVSLTGCWVVEVQVKLLVGFNLVRVDDLHLNVGYSLARFKLDDLVERNKIGPAFCLAVYCPDA